MTTEAHSIVEHLQELQHRTRLIAWAMFLACTTLYLVPGNRFGAVALGDASVAFGRLTRLTWVVYGALLLTWPLWVYHTWQFVAPGLSYWERRGLRSFITVLSLSLYLAWYTGGRYLWPWLQAHWGQPQGVWVWLGFDALSLLLRAEVLFAMLIAVGISSYRRVLATVSFWVSVVANLLVPPYLLMLFLLLMQWSSVWFSLSGRWRPLSLILPFAIGRTEIMQGMWPWEAIILTGLFFGAIALAPTLGKVVIGANSSHTEPPVRTEPKEPGPPQPRSPEPEIIRDPQAVQAMDAHLSHALAADNPTIRCQALSVLGRMRGQEHVERIVPFLRSDEKRPVRLAAVEALGMIGGEQAIEVLRELQTDADLVVRWKAQEVLEEYLLVGRKLPAARRLVTGEEPLVRILG